jgi:acetate kinase
LPHAVSVASFDNTFHATIPPVNYIYPIDQTIAKKYAIRRYGFHGNSYRYINKQMQTILNKDKLNLIVCHLGNGASITAIKNGMSYATSMGLTPLEGLMMGTRCGDIDPSIPIYLARQGMKNDEIDGMLNKKSGVQGMCGSSDMRDLQAKCNANNPEAQLTIEMYTRRVARYIVDYANQLEDKVDAIVFTAGIGENSTFVIKNTINNVKLVKLLLDEQTLSNKYSDYKLISSNNSHYPIYCVRTDEELMIAQDVEEMINKKK